MLDHPSRSLPFLVMHLTKPESESFIRCLLFGLTELLLVVLILISGNFNSFSDCFLGLIGEDYSANKGELTSSCELPIVTPLLS